MDMIRTAESTKVYITAEELAARWSTSTGTLANMRSLGRGPSYIKPLGRVLYDMEDIRFYEEDTRFLAAC